MRVAIPWWRKPAEYLALVRFSHTLFAMPFAIASALWAAQGLPSWCVSIWILLAMVTCRNAAMAFNRLVDARIDAKNPRTQGRHLPSGRLGRFEVWGFFLVNAAAFVVAAYALNPLAFALSVPTLAAVCAYSLTKRFTAYSHYVLGFAIAISPAGAWVAVTGQIGWPSVLLALALGTWIAGFDIIYATQDEAFDRKAGLHSVVVRFGLKGALRLAAVTHVLTFLALAAFAYATQQAWPFLAGLGLVAATLVYLHGFRRTASLEVMNNDFFLANVGISLCVLLGLIGSLWVQAG
jgi:4-hydroxybenzoate polyprenyltransferase